jgi:hypothetical protein
MTPEEQQMYEEYRRDAFKKAVTSDDTFSIHSKLDKMKNEQEWVRDYRENAFTEGSYGYSPGSFSFDPERSEIERNVNHGFGGEWMNQMFALNMQNPNTQRRNALDQISAIANTHGFSSSGFTKRARDHVELAYDRERVQTLASLIQKNNDAKMQAGQQLTEFDGWQKQFNFEVDMSQKQRAGMIEQLDHDRVMDKRTERNQEKAEKNQTLGNVMGGVKFLASLF